MSFHKISVHPYTPTSQHNIINFRCINLSRTPKWLFLNCQSLVFKTQLKLRPERAVDWHQGTSFPRPIRIYSLLNPENDANDTDTKEVKIDLQLPRRSRLVQFTCNLCNGRTERLVNPIAWEKGMVIVQCQHCKAWHKVADAANLVEEIRYADLENSQFNSDAE